MRVLLVFNTYLKSIVDDLKRQSIHLKVIYYGGRLFDDVGIKHWVEWADIVVAEDRILNHLGQVLEIAIWPASRYREAISGGGNGRSPAAIAAAQAQLGQNSFPLPGNPVLFFPSNDTHAKLLQPVAGIIKNYMFAIIDPRRREENASGSLRSLGEEFVPYKRGLVRKLQPSAVVLGNDWGGDERMVIQDAKALGIPTVCIQEGCLQWDGRMEWCDCAFVQGPVMLQYLDRKYYFITGNPRFDSIKKLPLPKKPTVMINCNFPYGIFEDWRDRWIGDVVKACEQAGLDFFIARHPRDPGEPLGLPIRPSSAMNVHEHIAQSSLLVTRFSTLVYEASLMGRSVVYYNPHGETMQLYNDDDTGGLTKVYSPDKLSQAIASTLQHADKNSTNREDFLRLHCGSLDHRAAERCATALADIANWYSADGLVKRVFALSMSYVRPNAPWTSKELSKALSGRFRHGKAS